eukprot:3111733-Amphidinium_carterae.1
MQLPNVPARSGLTSNLAAPTPTYSFQYSGKPSPSGTPFCRRGSIRQGVALTKAGSTGPYRSSKARTSTSRNGWTRHEWAQDRLAPETTAWLSHQPDKQLRPPELKKLPH